MTRMQYHSRSGKNTLLTAAADICGDEMINEPLQTAEDIIEQNNELEKSPAKWIEFVHVSL